MAIETNVEKLNETMTDGLAKLNAVVEDTAKLWEGHLTEGHDVMAQARDQGVALGNAIAKVRQFLVGKTNFPPQDDQTTA